MSVRIPSALAAWVDENARPSGELYQFLRDLGSIANNAVLQSVTVGRLPAAASNPGARFLVTDATSSTFHAAPVGGGGTIVPVYSNGTSWLIG